MKTSLANRKNYGAKRSTSKIKYIVIHYTGNDGDSDEANAKHFQRVIRQVSAHYFVDDDSITQTVPDDYVAWHCGAKKYKHPSCRNANSIGIEICDSKKDGKYYPTANTIAQVLDLTEQLMKKYNIPRENVIRHYDVTGKLCPAYWVDNAKWKAEFWNKLPGSVKTEVKLPYLVRITADSLNIRKGPGVMYAKTGVIKDGGAYTIVEEKSGWGKLKSGCGWISLKYTEKPQ